MSAPVKLIGFAGLVLALFAGAVLAGGAIGPDRDGDRRADADAGHGGDAMAGRGGDDGSAGHEDGAMAGHEGGADAADPVRGLAVDADGLQLALEHTELQRGRPSELAFAIVGADGRPIRDFDVEHEKRMHVVVVRRDGRGFQHVHPELGDDGTWRVPLTLPDAGAYRVFADFSHDGEPRTLAADLTVDGAADYRPLPAPATTTTTDGYEVRLDAGALRAGREAELRFSVARAGEPVRTEPYLGAGGHLVALREGDLAYLHVHPEGHSGAPTFMTEFPSEGRYRLYLQFKHEGRVHTAEFTQEVGR
jgi:hypothetical protein